MAVLLAGDNPRLVVTDPPYGVSIGDKNKFLNQFQKSGRRLENIEGDTLKPENLHDFLTPIFRLVRDVISDDATVYVTAPQGGDLGITMLLIMKDAGLPVRHILIWVKNQPTFSLGRLDYEYKHEPIFYTWKKRHQFFGKGTHRTSVWEIDRPRAAKLHPTMKPVELYENAMLNSSERGWVVLDPFSGSGTCLVAAQRLERQGRAMDVSPGYVAVALERLAEMGVEWERRIEGDAREG